MHPQRKIMGYTTEPEKSFSAAKSAKIMCIDTWDESCAKELRENSDSYSLVQFFCNIPKGMLDSLRCKSSISISLAGKEIKDISGLQNLSIKISGVIIGLIDKKAIESAPLNKIAGLESIRMSYLDGIQMQNIHGASIKKIFIEEVGKIKGAFNLAGLPCLEHLTIMKLGSVTSLNISDSPKIKHLVLEQGKKMLDITMSADLGPIEYVGLCKIPLAIAEKISLNKPIKVELEPKDIFKSKEDAQKLFKEAKIFWE
jgi:hypothetical protein